LNLIENQSLYVFNRITKFVDDRLAAEIAGDFSIYFVIEDFYFLKHLALLVIMTKPKHRLFIVLAGCILRKASDSKGKRLGLSFAVCSHQFIGNQTYNHKRF